MSYSVRWNRRSLDALAELWLDFPSDRNGITEAAATIDRLLRDRPDEQGESRQELERVLFAPPLVVSFTVDDSRHVVRIVNVRRLVRRNR